MTFVHVQLAGRIVHGAGALGTIPDELRLFGCRRALIVTSPSIATGSLGRLATEAVGELGIGLFGNGTVHVPMAAVLDLASVIARERPDALVAIGGGSALDTAKGAALAAAVDRPFRELHRDYIGNAQCVGHRELVRVITVPTTLSGAERTGAFSIVEGGRKLNYTEAHIRPAVVIQDGNLLRFTPRRVLMESGMNSIAHSVEALLSGTASPLQRPLYLESLRLHGLYLPRALQSADDTLANDRLLAAAALAGGLGGQNLSGRLGMIHSVTHAIAGATGAPHGAVFGVVIEQGMRFNGEVTPEELPEIAYALTGRRLDGDGAIEAFVDLRARLSLPARLSDIGVREADFDRIADAAMLHFGTAQNVRPIRSAADVRMLLTQMY